MFLREPQHVTAIGNVTDNDAHIITLCFSDVDLGPSTEPGVTSMLAPAPAEFRSVVAMLWVARFPCEDAIIRVYHLKKRWTKAGTWSGVVGSFEILNAAEDDCNVAA